METKYLFQFPIPMYQTPPKIFIIQELEILEIFFKITFNCTLIKCFLYYKCFLKTLLDILKFILFQLDLRILLKRVNLRCTNYITLSLPY